MLRQKRPARIKLFLTSQFYSITFFLFSIYLCIFAVAHAHACCNNLWCFTVLVWFWYYLHEIYGRYFLVESENNKKKLMNKNQPFRLPARFKLPFYFDKKKPTWVCYFIFFISRSNGEVCIRTAMFDVTAIVPFPPPDHGCPKLDSLSSAIRIYAMVGMYSSICFRRLLIAIRRAFVETCETMTLYSMFCATSTSLQVSSISFSPSFNAHYYYSLIYDLF